MNQNEYPFKGRIVAQAGFSGNRFCISFDEPRTIQLDDGKEHTFQSALCAGEIILTAEHAGLSVSGMFSVKNLWGGPQAQIIFFEEIPGPAPAPQTNGVKGKRQRYPNYLGPSTEPA